MRDKEQLATSLGTCKHDRQTSDERDTRVGRECRNDLDTPTLHPMCHIRYLIRISWPLPGVSNGVSLNDTRQMHTGSDLQSA